MKRLALILLLLLLLGHGCASNASDAVGDLLKEGQTDVAARKFDDALNLYEQVITGHPEALDRWFNAQEAIATALAAKGDLAEAVKASHIAMDGAPNWQSYDEAVTLTANILSALDKNVDRANQFLTFQLKGPVDGTVNPMEAIGYPSLPGREQAFAILRKQAGDNAEASRLRAYTFLYTGKPHDALAQFADAFRRSSGSHDFDRSAPDLVLVGLRAARGHRVGLENALHFVIYGPGGPDGKPGTADNIADPFAGLLSEAPIPGNGGLAEIPADELTALRQVRDAARLYAGDSQLSREMRRAALDALERTNVALDGWGEKGQMEWYLQRALDCVDPEVQETLFSGAQAAARGRSLHFGGVYAMWNEVDAYCAAHKVDISRETAPTRRDFNLVVSAMSRIQFREPSFKMLTTPISFESHSK